MVSTLLDLKLDKTNYYLGEKVVIHGSLFKSDDGTSGVADALVNLKINNLLQTIKTDSNGHFNYEYKTQSVGTYNVKLSYDGDSQYKKGDDVSGEFRVIDKVYPKLTLHKLRFFWLAEKIWIEIIFLSIFFFLTQFKIYNIRSSLYFGRGQILLSTIISSSSM